MSWVLVDNLVNLREQINAWAPDRDHASDGTIGDPAHQRELSGHNPDDTAGSLADYNDHDGVQEVRAFDGDVNFNNGATAQQLVDHIRKLPGIGKYIRYMIYNRHMYHVRDGFQPTPYTGSNPHTDHIHFESAWNQQADTSNGYNYHLGDIEIMLSSSDLDQIRAIVQAPYVDTLNGGLVETEAGHQIGSQQWPDYTQNGVPQVAYYQAFGNAVKVLMDVAKKLDQVITLLQPKP